MDVRFAPVRSFFAPPLSDRFYEWPHGLTTARLLRAYDLWLADSIDFEKR